MKRRDLLKGAGLGLAGAALARPALAQNAPELNWRLASAFPKTLDTLFGTAELFARYVAEATDNRFKIQVLAAGEIVPGGPAPLDAASDNTVEMAHTATYYSWGKDPTFALGTAIPFGLNSRMQNAWMYYGGGIDLMNEFFAKHNVYGLPGGNTGAQMGGWFRKEINTTADLNGLKFRIAGLAGAVLSKVGVVPQQIAASDIYPALEKGTIDATEFVGPYDDQRLGFVQVAPYYYYPAFWEIGAMLHFLINKAQWDGLPPAYQAIVRAAAQAANCDMQARYDHVNPQAIRDLVAAGAQLRPLSQEIMEASYEAAQQTYTELSAANADFKKVYDSMVAYRGDAYLWFQISEYTADTFMMNMQRAGKL
jgi:TRAP-type mannitol/chloroaromatic compound transport system substrate-binding protein